MNDLFQDLEKRKKITRIINILAIIGAIITAVAWVFGYESIAKWMILGFVIVFIITLFKNE